MPSKEIRNVLVAACLLLGLAITSAACNPTYNAENCAITCDHVATQPLCPTGLTCSSNNYCIAPGQICSSSADASSLDASIVDAVRPIDASSTDSSIIDDAVRLVDASSTDARTIDAARPVDASSADARSVDAFRAVDAALPPPDAKLPPTITTYAGNGMQGFANGTGGPGGTAEFYTPFAVAVGGDGKLYVADVSNHRIRVIDTGGNASNLAGDGNSGYVDGTSGVSSTSEFYGPSGVAVDSANNVYVADSGNNRIRKIAANGTVTTLAGNGTAGFADGTGGATGTAEFSNPSGIAVDSTGHVYVADYLNNRIRVVDSSGNVTTLSGNGTRGFVDGTGGATGTAEFNRPTAVAVDSAGTVYVADEVNNRIRVVHAGGSVTTLAGDGNPNFVDGTGGATGTAEFDSPTGVAIDIVGNVYVADYTNNRIRLIDSSGNVTTLAGNGTAGFFDGTAGPTGTAKFFAPAGVIVDAAGNVYVADSANNRIRKIHQ